MENKTHFVYKIVTVLFLIGLILPLVVLVIWSFVKIWPWPMIIPASFGLRAWSYFFDSTSDSLSILFYSVYLSFVVSVLTLVITVPAAKALALYKFKGKKLVEVLTFAPIIVPTITIAMGIHVQFIQLGIANKFIGVVLIQIIPCIPYAVRILKSVFEIIGEQMELQARVLGASTLQAFRYITVPMILPGLISAGSMVFIVSFSQYFLTFLIGGGKIITFSMLMFPFIQSGDRMMGSVYSIVFVTTALIFLIIIEKLTTKFYRGQLEEYKYV